MSINNVEDLTSKVEEYCNALCEPERIRLIQALGGDEKCACDLAEATCMHPLAVRNHMRVLSLAGVVAERKIGKWMYYAQDMNAAEDVASGSCVCNGRTQVAVSPIALTHDIDSTLGKLRSPSMYEAEALCRRGC